MKYRKLFYLLLSLRHLAGKEIIKNVSFVTVCHLKLSAADEAAA